MIRKTIWSVILFLMIAFLVGVESTDVGAVSTLEDNECQNNVLTINPLSGLPAAAQLPAKSVISPASSPTNSWTKYAENPVLDVGASGSWDSCRVGQPSILSNGQDYELWYAGSSTMYNFRIGYATSTDGVNWTKYAGNPVLIEGAAGSWDGGYANAPHVIFHDGVYKMWYRGSAELENSQGAAIGYATSPDGVNWVKHSGNPVLDIGPAGSWDSNAIWSQYVIIEGKTYKMWYSAGDHTYHRIGYATSADGVSWTKYAGNPVLDTGPSGSWEASFVYYPNVIRDSGSYQMWYSGFDGESANPTIAIGYAVSADGLRWTKYDGNPVLAPGAAGSWDSKYIIASAVAAQSGIYQMWYTGMGETGNDRLGYATSKKTNSLGLMTFLPAVIK